MNIGLIGSGYLHTTSTAQTAQGLQTAISPVSQTETLTRINATQNTPNAENKPNTQQGDTSKNADEVANQYQRLGKNVNNYKAKDGNKNEDKENRTANSKEETLSADNPQGLSEEELKELKELTKRDQEVRTHEQAHMATAGQYARGGINLETTTGPDGKSYAVGGHVNIDTSPVPNNPQATIQKANKIRAAAMAPADPSSQDRSVAAAAMKMATEARSKLAEQQTEETKSSLKAKEGNSNEVNGSTETENKASSEYRKVAGLEINQADQQIIHQVA